MRSIRSVQRYEEFVQRGNIDPSLVLVLLHTIREPSSNAVIDDAVNTEFHLISQMSGLRVIPFNIDRDDDNLRLEFNDANIAEDMVS
ncbi:hypothetical protein X798_04437 [Onchocerca flexuosa]|uniref:Uncharacterized protein n=1 Tax=Onchocerca flexuosa TaxID=387005 RepID=A0A238BUX5_9BILA|nr:hypothetical protein X798_04437 [Onchocerca flexuosa]